MRVITTELDNIANFVSCAGRPSAFEGIEQLPQQIIEMAPNVEAVKQFIVEHTS
jgi:hypothetical protein